MHVLLTGGGAALLLITFSGVQQALFPGEGAAFLAPQLEALGHWWNSLSPAQQVLFVAAGATSLMLVPGVGFWAALGWSSLAAGVAASGRDLADTIRYGTPADLLLAGTVMVLGGRMRGLDTSLSRGYRRYGLGSLPRGFTSLPGNRYQSPAGPFTPRTAVTSMRSTWAVESAPPERGTSRSSWTRAPPKS